MKRLSDFSFAENGMDVAVELMRPISKLSGSKEFRELKSKGGFTTDDIAKTLVKNEPEALCEVFAILSGMTVEEYKEKSNTASFLVDLYTMFSDDNLMLLFGVQLRNMEKPSSGAATETTGAKKK